jgi:hypothetical protein
MHRYPHCKTTYRVAFYGVIFAALLIGVASREAFLGGEALPLTPSAVGGL